MLIIVDQHYNGIWSIEMVGGPNYIRLSRSRAFERLCLIIAHSSCLAGVLIIILRGERATQKISFTVFMGGFILLMRHPESLVAAIHTLPYLGSFSIGGVTALTGMLALTSVAIAWRLIRRIKLAGNLTILLLLVFFAYLLLNWYVSGPPDGISKIKLFFIRGIIPAVLILTFGNGQKRFRGFLGSAVVFAFLLSLMILTAYFGISGISDARWGDSGRISLFGFDPISISLPIGIACVIILHFILSGKVSPQCRGLLIALFSIMFFSIFPTGTRQMVLAVAMGALIYTLFIYKSYFSKVVVSVSVAIMLIAGFFIVISHYKGKRFDVASSGYLQDRSFQGRFLTMQKGLATFNRAPLVGVGAGGHGEYRKKVNPYTGKTSREKEHIHNLFVELLAEQGLIGFMLFMAPVIYSIVRLLHLLRRRANNPLFRSNGAVLCALFGFAFVQSNISGGLSVSGGLIVTLTAWAGVVNRNELEFRRYQ